MVIEFDVSFLSPKSSIKFELMKCDTQNETSRLTLIADRYGNANALAKHGEMNYEVSVLNGNKIDANFISSLSFLARSVSSPLASFRRRSTERAALEVEFINNSKYEHRTLIRIRPCYIIHKMFSFYLYPHVVLLRYMYCVWTLTILLKFCSNSKLTPDRSCASKRVPPTGHVK